VELEGNLRERKFYGINTIISGKFSDRVVDRKCGGRRKVAYENAGEAR